ncbi:MAG: glycosyltransferase family 4 protein [Pseudomonadales bacterium]
MTIAESILTTGQQPVADILSLAEAPRRSLRICLLGYRSDPFGGGQGVYIRYLSKALLEAGHSVDVISGEPYPHVVDGVRLIKMPGLNLYANGLFSLRPRHLGSMANIVEWFSKLTGGFAEPYSFGLRVVKYLRQHGQQYDLIHDNQSLCSGLLQLQEMGLSVVTTVHHPITSDLQIALNASHRWWERLLIRRWHSFLRMQTRVVRRLKHVITVSDCSRTDIAKAFAIDRDAIALIYNGIDTEVFKPCPEVPRAERRLIATASADQPLKGLHFLLKAFVILRKEFPDLQLLVIGKPKPGGKTEKLVRRLHLGEELRFERGITTQELVERYAASTLAVVPSIYEGFGLPAGEAMACGVPVVSTDGGALPEVVGDAGVIVPTADAEGLATAIAALLNNPTQRAELAQRGRERILAKFSWRVVAHTLTDYYEQVLAHADR